MFTHIAKIRNDIMNVNFRVSRGIPHTRICMYTCVCYKGETQ